MTAEAAVAPPSGADPAGSVPEHGGGSEHAGAPAGFTVDLENFSGPFDVLLDLIARRSLDITDIALAEVTDDFLAYVATLRGTKSLDELSHFLLVASTLLDLKLARLLPGADVEDELDLELLEARDLLFARLLQYRAYKEVSRVLEKRMGEAARAVPRAVPLEKEFTDILPPLDFSTSGPVLAAVFGAVLSRDRTPPAVALDHLHDAHVSVPQQRALLLSRLRDEVQIDFAALIEDAETRMVVVARFLAVLELFKAGLCDFDQPEALGPLTIALTATDARGAGDAGGDRDLGSADAEREETADG
ncbi:segregation and condensation protein A [Brevibacterium jeotgali]|uniref:segregation and condensation protein A n=1 Tax=Brevibacterium jeotgali TaxID=1262550 RepID=UPI001FE50BD2|nr:ScpA family protein [Brevibacterium jeotgali]